MPSPPAYTPLAAHDAAKAPSPSSCTAPPPLSHKLADEAARCDTDRATSTANASTKEADEHAFYSADQPWPSRTAAARAAVATSVVALVALGVVGFALCGGTEGVAALGRAAGCGGTRAQELQQQGGGEQHQWARRQVDEAEEGDSATGKEEFSTTTYLGDVTTYVKTTRPIVNPGGYTFGTLTGYVPVPTTTASATASTVNSSSSSPASLEPASGASFSRSDTSLPAAPTSSAAPSPSSAHDECEPWASRDAADSSLAASPSSTARPVARRLIKRVADPEPAWDFAAVDAHLLHRRGEDFEAGESVSQVVEEEEQAPVTGKEEFSTSTNRQGGVVTLVKTTRPIVNPGGYVIGTLDGAWVDVARQTDRTTLPPSPTSAVSPFTPSAPAAASSAAPASSIDEGAAELTPTSAPGPAHKRAHDELRRRDVVQLAPSQ